MKALITGAGSGIGRDIAHYLASFGYDLVLVDIDEDSLNSSFKDSRVKVKKIILDLSKTENCYKLYDMTKKERIDILVNNVGFGDCGYFYKTSLEKELEMIDVNIKCGHILTKLFLNDFVKRDYGYILNVSSMASFMPGPNMACYYATKAYVTSLSLSIYEELRKLQSNVNLSVLCPGPVKTNFNAVANVKFNVASVDSEFVARYAVDNMFKKKLIIIPSMVMKGNYILTRILPENLLLNMTSNIQERVN
ncbi:MAG: SDR family NAD(P)-dependent oxidoreductase [bacterium]|nr:SDR family NAD(P)-dependent oxidoreductase [bacterium]